MSKCFLIVDIPEQILKDALRSVKNGQTYTIHIESCFVPRDDDSIIPENDTTVEVPKIEIDRLTSGSRITADDIINAKKTKGLPWK